MLPTTWLGGGPRGSRPTWQQAHVAAVPRGSRPTWQQGHVTAGAYGGRLRSGGVDREIQASKAEEKGQKN